MDITINEFARRICEANHTINDHGNPSRAIPCMAHLQIARQSWGLIEPAGAKTLGAIIAVAIESGVKPEFHITFAGSVLESHVGADGIRVIDKVDVTAASLGRELEGAVPAFLERRAQDAHADARLSIGPDEVPHG